MKETKSKTLDEFIENKYKCCQSQEISNEIFENFSWQYAKKEWVDTGKISEDDFDDLFNIAKTRNPNDVYRLCDFYFEDSTFNRLIKIRNYYDVFRQGVNKNIIKGEDRNLYNKRIYKDFDEFEYKMDDVNYEIEISTKRVPPVNQVKVKNESSLIYEDDSWQIYQIFGFDASRHYGRDTRWCISANSYAGFDSFEEHDKSKDIYFIVSKRPRFDNYRKIVVLMYRNGVFEYSDANDNILNKNLIKYKTGIDLDSVNW